jgi:Glycosyl transferases group 1/DUF based on E. rectale Gene description (DUF3880)
MNKVSDGRRVMLVGQFGPGALERSYRAAFQSLDWEVSSFDVEQAIEAYCRGGRWGRRVNRFVPIEAWIRKGNRDLVTEAITVQPEFLLTFGHYEVQPGALAQIRAATKCSLIHVWPDTLLNLSRSLVACLPLFDLVATYSKSSVVPLERLGAKSVAWVPLASDPSVQLAVLNSDSTESQSGSDVSFIGGWRPEREALLSTLGAFDLKIWGPDWGRRCRNNPIISKSWQGRALYEAEFAECVASSKISLNLIDPLNYPAANMRFFEVPAWGGLQVSSACPEMENEFLHGEHIFYYNDENYLHELIVRLLDDKPLRARVAKASQTKVLSQHTYADRVRSILSRFENGLH